MAVAHQQRSAIYLLTKSLQDMLEPSRFGYKFIFRLHNDKDLERACAILDIEHTTQNIEIVKSFAPGECFISDLKQRVNKIQYTLHNDTLAKMFSKQIVEDQSKKQDELKPQLV